MEFSLTVAFLINDVERRFHYQYDSFQECSQAREVMGKDETPTPCVGHLHQRKGTAAIGVPEGISGSIDAGPAPQGGAGVREEKNE